uniref:protein N-lysine methyltransferase FAM173A isoform X3 n=1 Tax=Macaca mulatta TaxID=9544 RepID=UPI0010A243C7|nr:protein N-lysine methyltransferase FAM173A isoform X3 [Macaca mulatta]
MEQDDPAEALTELRERRLGALELLQAAAGSGLAAYAVWALLLQPGFRRVPLRLQPGALRWRERAAGGARVVAAARPPRKNGGFGLWRRQDRKCPCLGLRCPTPPTCRRAPLSPSWFPHSRCPQVLAAHRCGLRPAVGYELNPWLVALARLHAWRAGCAGSVCYRRKDLWKVSLRDCRNVSVFLAPSVLPLLEDKLRAELPAGARVVSGRFPLPTWQPVAVAGEGLDRVWAYDVPGGGQAGEAVSSRIPIQAAP